MSPSFNYGGFGFPQSQFFQQSPFMGGYGQQFPMQRGFGGQQFGGMFNQGGFNQQQFNPQRLPAPAIGGTQQSTAQGQSLSEISPYGAADPSTYTTTYPQRDMGGMGGMGGMGNNQLRQQSQLGMGSIAGIRGMGQGGFGGQTGGTAGQPYIGDAASNQYMSEMGSPVNSGADQQRNFNAPFQQQFQQPQFSPFQQQFSQMSRFQPQQQFGGFQQSQFNPYQQQYGGFNPFQMQQSPYGFNPMFNQFPQFQSRGLLF